MTIEQAQRQIVHDLSTIYAPGEATAMSDWIIEYLTSTKKSDRLSQKQKELSPEQVEKLSPITQRLLQHEPLQYVLNEAWFCGLKFYVDKNVLIPRPETEELVEWVISNCKFPIDQLSILDIGTGSGCIPITLKRKVRRAEVSACDISEAALQVAKKNADAIGTTINFIQLDFLDKEKWDQLPAFDIIITNPPYVPERDSSQMSPNVLNYEPHTALFVPNDDALIFYKAIAEFAEGHLNPSGTIYMEIHEDLGSAASSIFEATGYATKLKKDMSGKERMLRATRDLI